MNRYVEFNGDLDEWVRSQKDALDNTLTGDEWNQIDKVVQRLRIQKGNNASLDYKNETDRVLQRLLETEEVIQIAKDLALRN